MSWSSSCKAGGKDDLDKKGGEWQNRIFFYVSEYRSKYLKLEELPDPYKRALSESIEEVEVYKSPLDEDSKDAMFFNHLFVVFKTKSYFWSVEKYAQGIYIQINKNKDQVHLYDCCGTKRNENVTSLRSDLGKDTEIDWIAYMQEVEGFLNGTLDYEKLGGQTGPLVYPAGFVYFYSALYWLTKNGENIRLAQFVFLGIYILTLCLIFRIYHKMIYIPNYVLVFMCCTSYRIHSIYMLRLFNDPVAMMLLYAAVNCFLDNQYSAGSIIFSLAVSVKMNVLLFAPGLLVVYLCNKGFWETIGHLCECASVQLLLGMPFLIRSTQSYINRAFEFNRQFLYKWTVNWRLLPESTFLDRRFHLLLLFIHLVLLFVILRKFLKARKTMKMENKRIDDSGVVMILFMCNFIGVVCSRSLHYQFYVWYYHSFPVLLWSIPGLSSVTRLLIWGIIEMCWNTYPSTTLSSACLHLSHLVILYHWLRNNCFQYVYEQTQQRKVKEH